MKKLLYLLPFLLLMACESGSDATSATALHINLTVPNADTAQAKLMMRINGEFEEVDAANFENDKVRLSVDSLEGAQLMFVYLPTLRKQYLVFGQEGTLNITEDLNAQGSAITYTGTKYAEALTEYGQIQADYQMFQSMINQEAQRAQQANDMNTIMQLQQSMMQKDNEKVTKLTGLAKESGAFGAFIAIAELYTSDLATLDSIYSNIPVADGKAPMVTELKNKIDVMKRTQVGEPLIDMAFPSPEGELVRISEELGESYTLIDFWASWCRPCRAENPNVVAAYQQFSDRGFQVIGVSLDGGNTRTTKNDWVQAIEQDNLTWPHLSDLNGWNSEAATKYGVQSIPYNVMVDENGIIVAKNLRAQELLDWLAERL